MAMTQIRTAAFAGLAAAAALILAQPRDDPAAAQQALPSALVVAVEGAIGPGAAHHVERALEHARASRTELVVLRLDTPGGLATSMRDIIRDILASPVPVVGYVAPSGAHAASAGTYILYACHVAAMAPGTNLGAATPIAIGGGSPGGSSPADKEDEKSHPTGADKSVSDAVAYIRALAQMRGRNAEWAEKAVREAASLSARDAADDNVVDLVAGSLSQLLDAIDGRTVQLEKGPHRLASRDLVIVPYEADWRTRFLSIITDPNIAYILMLIGIYGILFEFYSPGLVGPGVIGAISLLTALYAFQILPINIAGFALLAVGLALMVAEAFTPGIGVAGLGGATAFVIGSVMLFEDVPGIEVSPVLIGSVAALSAGLMLFTMVMLLRSRERKVVTGVEQMIGGQARIVDWSGTAGRVHIHGEVWGARGPEGFTAGDRVEVVAIDGLTLRVAPQPEEKAP